ncbi:MAG: GAF domain-containing sensor histidine kinase [Anaerolineae bacterium]|nr:GAF domain-containing sensor histidine kinase [Anaerolineae bacterium]
MELTSVYLTEELAGLRQRVADLEASEAECRSIEAELRERAYQQAMIAKLGQRVLAGGDFDPLLDEITVLVTQTLKVDYCQILELHPDRDLLRLRAGSGWPTALIGQATIKADPTTHLGYTLFSSKPIIIEDLRTDPRFNESGQLFQHKLVSGVSVIVDGEQWPFGVLSVHTAHKRKFTQDDIYFLQAVANILGTTADHRRTQLALQEAHDKLEQRVKERTADLQAANEELRNFAYIISHDLRAPLVNIKGFAGELDYSLEMLRASLDHVLPQLDDAHQADLTTAIHQDIPEALDFINSSVSRMNSLINAILKLSRLGRRELLSEAIDMTDLVQDTLNSLAHQIEQTETEVTLAPLPQVVADRTSMEQIMGNLLANALNYLTPTRPGRIEISAQITPKTVTFRISDNGRGIAQDDLPKIFDIFRRAGRQDVPGEGMGLAYVRTLVRRHGGQIYCESELEVGSTFIFTIARNLAEELENDR